MKLTRTDLLTSGTSAAAVMLASYAGLTRMLGAHPWWAVKCGLMGAGLGLLLVLAARALSMPPRKILIAAVLLLLPALAAAHFGKSAFVAAEDFNAVAGRYWYFGWIGIAAATQALLTAGLLLVFNRR